jgi:hypothetical protein
VHKKSSSTIIAQPEKMLQRMDEQEQLESDMYFRAAPKKSLSSQNLYELQANRFGYPVQGMSP